jgi:signal transduction histidine kinase
MPVLNFTVDAALLQELGERLVGRPSTALAELVKNSYDADASYVSIKMQTLGPGTITVVDDGQGMTFDEFSQLWMRLGSTHKRSQRKSRRLGRPLTGSKGVGRIAAQLLSHSIAIASVSDKEPKVRLVAKLNWDKALRAADLVSVEVEYDLESLEQPAAPGTTIVMSGLKQNWTPEDLSSLARDVWRLQPPFRPSTGGRVDPSDFRILFDGSENEMVQAFQEQLEAFSLLWVARATGENSSGKATIRLQFRGERPLQHTFAIPDCQLRDGRFELRFYELKHRQPRGITIAEARQYLDDFGGVLIYDAGFRLPFYGEKDNDWLKISYDTSRRLSRSLLLPDELQITEGMQQLPQWSQVIGQVDVNTATEKSLKITITRDRLVDSRAYEQLRDFVRRAIDWYAMEKTRRRVEDELQQAEISPAPTSAIHRVNHLLTEYKDRIPQALSTRLRASVDRALDETKALESRTGAQIATLSSLATAGVSSLAYQHELDKQLNAIATISERLVAVAAKSRELAPELLELKTELETWAARARQIGRIFSHLTEPENLQEERRYKLEQVLSDVINQIGYLAKSATFQTARIDADLRLPRATYAEWVSVFQNLFYNALNAMVDSKRRLVDCSTTRAGRHITVFVQDTGAGVDLERAEEFFKPFVRQINISPERRELGFGGTGLGLSIVRMITDKRGCTVHFAKPSTAFSTSIAIEWDEEA